MKLGFAVTGLASLALLASCGLPNEAVTPGADLRGATSGSVIESDTLSILDDGCLRPSTRIHLYSADPNVQRHVGDLILCRSPNGDGFTITNQTQSVWSTWYDGRLLSTTEHPIDWERELFLLTLGRESAHPVLLPGETRWYSGSTELFAVGLDLPLSFAWQGHTVVREEVSSLGLRILYAAVKKRTPSGFALLVCTQAVHEVARTNADLRTADPADVVLAGLGVGAQVSGCRDAAAQVPIMDEFGNETTLESRIGSAVNETAQLNRINKGLTWAQRFARFARLLPRGP